MGTLARRILRREREAARQPFSWVVFFLLGLASVVQILIADTWTGRLFFAASSVLSMHIALLYFRAGRDAGRVHSSRTS